MSIIVTENDGKYKVTSMVKDEKSEKWRTLWPHKSFSSMSDVCIFLKEVTEWENKK